MVRVRFAPSPTGYLHMGNARTAFFNWLFARANQGKFILRVEDTDVVRSKEIYFRNILEDMRWLGLDWDEGPGVGGPFAPYRQSERLNIYNEYADKLLKEKKAYPCFCSDAELKKRKEEALKKGLPPRYDNRCRNLTSDEIEKAKKRGKKIALRFKVPAKILIINDLIKGEVQFDASLIGDFVIMKSKGTPSFNFAVVSDDLMMKISHVIRGEDHLSNTPKHILLFEALGAEPPKFAHMSLTMAPGGERLSKREGALSIARYRELGYLPEAVRNYIALLGWAPEGNKEIVSTDQMIKEFKIEKLSKSSEAFDPRKLDWMNGVYIREADLDRLTELAVPYLVQKKFIKKESAAKRFGEIKKIVSAVRDHLSSVSQITEYAGIFLKELIRFKNKSLQNQISKSEAQAVLKSFLENIKKIDILNEENFNTLTENVKKDTKAKGKDLYMPLRISLTGEEHGPELKLIVPILGRERCMDRIRQALKVA